MLVYDVLFRNVLTYSSKTKRFVVYCATLFTIAFSLYGVASAGAVLIHELAYSAVYWLVFLVGVFFLLAMLVSVHDEELKLLRKLASDSVISYDLHNTRRLLSGAIEERNAVQAQLSAVSERIIRFFGEPNRDCCARCLSDRNNFCSRIRTGSCAVCLDDNVALTAMVPCGHIVVCSECFETNRMRQCPFCREDCIDAVRLYDVSPPPPPPQPVDVPLPPVEPEEAPPSVKKSESNKKEDKKRRFLMRRRRQPD
jgi:hypothetical protein